MQGFVFAVVDSCFGTEPVGEFELMHVIRLHLRLIPRVSFSILSRVLLLLCFRSEERFNLKVERVERQGDRVKARKLGKFDAGSF